jgi:hypothetical protein
MSQPGQRADAVRDRRVAQLGRGDEAHAAGGALLGQVPRPG